MKKLFITLCGIALLSSISGHAFAENTNCPAKNPPTENMNRPHKFSPEMKAKMEQKRAEFEKKLNLAPDQKTKMKAIHQASREKMKPLFESMKAERAKLEQLKTGNSPAKDIQAQQDKIRQIKDQIKAERKSNFEQVQAILTPAQQKVFNEMHQKNNEKHRHFGDEKSEHENQK
jgi:Spy/CpxP family protein refolding chaperone